MIDVSEHVCDICGNGPFFPVHHVGAAEYKHSFIPMMKKRPDQMDAKEKRPGYHLREIPKGEIGELSKVAEELEEVLDAERQGVKVMVLIELSDMYGAIVRYLDKHHPGTTMDDIAKMAAITRRAFDNGHRKEPPKK